VPLEAAGLRRTIGKELGMGLGPLEFVIIRLMALPVVAIVVIAVAAGRWLSLTRGRRNHQP